MAAPPASPYEFTAEENALLRKLASRMHFVGLFALGTGLLVIGAGALRGYWWSILSGAGCAVVGIWTHRASVSFRHVVETEGHDLHHLMYAIEDLRKLYNFQFWLCLAALVIALCVLVGGTVLVIQGR